MSGAASSATGARVAAGEPERHDLLASMAATLREAVATGEPASLILIDINGFAEINAAWGIAAGDALLAAAGQRIAELGRLLGPGVVSGRLDADHFVLLERRGRDQRSLEEAVAGIVRAASQAYLIGGKTLTPSARAAIVRLPEHASSVSTALARGFRLLNSAARLRPGGVVVSTAQDPQAQGTGGLERDLAAALHTDQIFIALQPKVSASDGRVTGAEALVRWRHPARGLLPPSMFVPVAESSGLIIDLGLRVLRDACRATTILNAPAQGLAVAVNIAPAQLSHPDFLSGFLQVVDEEGVSPSSIEVEITETAAMMGGEQVMDSIRSFRRCGFGIAIDDFGTGFSNLASLSKLHADTLKIDRSLVAHPDHDARSAALLELTVQLAHTFAMSTVAEGVETPAQLERVRAVGCDFVQGYLTGKPVEAAVFGELYLKGATRG